MPYTSNFLIYITSSHRLQARKAELGIFATLNEEIGLKPARDG